ncbi:hypothetical protein [Paenibacillus sp. KR2-11]|uniref:hypothetical protein n=1 Tax=Paenibacillus sp. KR2-11 TaxID=3385500 RepID=UPI0038FD2744
MLDWLFKTKEREREIVTTSVDYYDSPTDLNLFWDDVIEVLSLAADSSEQSVKKLKDKYKLQNKYGHDLYVTLAAPKHEGYRATRSHYPGDSWDFTVEQIQEIHHEELEKRKKKVEWERKNQEEEKLRQDRNTTESLQRELRGLNTKRK